MKYFFKKKFLKSDPSSAMKTKLSITESLTKRRLRLVEEGRYLDLKMSGH